jgi:predicted transcriptional regulator
MLLPAIDHDSTETIVEAVTDDGLAVESVLTPALEATVTAQALSPLVREMVATGRSDIYVSTERLPCYLGLADDGRVQVGVADDDGLPRALLETTDEAVREWGETLYEQYRADARHKPVEDF